MVPPVVGGENRDSSRATLLLCDARVATVVDLNTLSGLLVAEYFVCSCSNIFL